MTTFIDKRAAALGITGELSTADRIALDHNAQLEKAAIAVRLATDAWMGEKEGRQRWMLAAEAGAAANAANAESGRETAAAMQANVKAMADLVTQLNG